MHGASWLGAAPAPTLCPRPKDADARQPTGVLTQVLNGNTNMLELGANTTVVGAFAVTSATLVALPSPTTAAFVPASCKPAMLLGPSATAAVPAVPATDPLAGMRWGRARCLLP
jgi:hypothetical protein